MKPRTKKQKEVFALSQKLRPLTPKQEQWAIDNCIDESAYLCKGEIWCLHCGAVSKYDSVDICPVCGKKLKVKKSTKKRYAEDFFFTVATTSRGYQVCRNFEISRCIRKGDKPHVYINEVIQNWIDENGNETVIARSLCGLGYSRRFDYSKPMTIKESGSYKYDVWSDVYPRIRVIPILKRNGYTGKFKEISLSALFKSLLKDRFSEKLIKTRQYSLLSWYLRGGYTTSIHAVHIAIRHKYIVKDASLWLDYISLLKHFKKDTHNPKYLLIDNVKEEHDRLLAKKERIEAEERARRERERRIREAERDKVSAQKYNENKGKYFGICFGNENIIITVIKSLDEMRVEGDSLHHCVFSMRYFDRDDSLILSAKDRDGNRLETIELSLKTFEVLQCRGKHNKDTEYHNDILKLVQKNINRFKNVA